MNKQASLLAGTILIVLGILTTVFTIGMPMFGWSVWNVFHLANFWPLSLISIGLGFVLPPFLFSHRRGLGGLFIPGMPILVTGAVLLFTSVFHWWGAWSWLWPLEVLAVAAGFVLAAIHMRNIWLMIPATVIGANGLLFQFCAITHLWEVWAVMWSIEPLSVGLALLLIGARKHRSGLMTAGLLLCSIGGAALVGMSAIMSFAWVAAGMWLVRFLMPVMLVLGGVLLLLWGLARRSASFKVG